MASLQNYKGLDVLSSAIGAGGEAINDDFKALVDWNPKCNWEASADPTIDDDTTDDYQVGSLWFNEDTGALFRCIDPADGDAIWRGVPVGVVGFTAWNTTTNTTATQLFLDGSSELIVIPQDTTCAFTIITVARNTTSFTGDSMVWETKGAIYRRTTGGTSLIGTNITNTWDPSSGSLGWTLDITAGSGNDELKIEGTGASSTTIDWSAFVQLKVLTV